MILERLAAAAVFIVTAMVLYFVFVWRLPSIFFGARRNVSLPRDTIQSKAAKARPYVAEGVRSLAKLEWPQPPAGFVPRQNGATPSFFPHGRGLLLGGAIMTSHEPALVRAPRLP